jgi:hypothetical protein
MQSVVSKPPRISFGAARRDWQDYRILVAPLRPLIDAGCDVGIQLTLMPTPHFGSRMIAPTIRNTKQGPQNLIAFDPLFTEAQAVKNLRALFVICVWQKRLH